MSDNHSKMELENRTDEAMIEIFCHRQHGNREGLCSECRELLDYVVQRLEKCPFQENQSTPNVLYIATNRT